MKGDAIYVPAQFITAAGWSKAPVETKRAAPGWTLVFTQAMANRQLTLTLDDPAKGMVMTLLHLDVYSDRADLAARHLSKGLLLETPDSSGWTPLHLAARLGRVEMIKFLLDAGAAINAAGPERLSPLQVAIGARQVMAAKLLLDKGAARDTQTINAAAEQGLADVVDYLLVHGTKCDGDAALTAAARGGSASVVETLTSRGIKITTANPLLAAVQAGNTLVIDRLLAKGANINAKNDDGVTPLLAATSAGMETMAACVINKGGNVNLAGSDTCLQRNSIAPRFSLSYQLAQITPLHLAALSGRLPLVKLLVQKGADVRAKAAGGVTPLHCAMLAPRATGNDPNAVIALLLAKGADANAVTDEFLLTLNAGKAITEMKMNRITPLHLLALLGDAAAVKSLLKAGADAKAKAGNGLTPLHLAVLNGLGDKLCPLLLDNGAEVNAKTDGEMTPLKLATTLNVITIADVLRKRGGQE